MQGKSEFHVENTGKFGVFKTEKDEKGGIMAPFERFTESQRAGDGNAEKPIFQATNQDLSPAGDGSNFRLHGIYFTTYKFDYICSSAKIYIKELLLCNRINKLALCNRYWGVKKVIKVNCKEVYIRSYTHSAVVSCIAC